MTRDRSIKAVLQNTFSILTWILPLAIITVPLYLVITRVWIPAFSPDSIVPAGYLNSGHVDQGRCYMSWQEPFDYEVTFYASEMYEFPSRRNGFFKTSQLLWRTEPQSIKNKYPVLRRNVSVSLSSDVFSQNKPVYIFAFAQRYGQFTMHPNISDPLLVGARSVVFAWKQSSVSDDTNGENPQPAKDTLTPVYLPNLLWSVTLENTAYLKDSVPKLLLRPERSGIYPGICLYQPLLFPNMFTSRKVKTAHLSSIRDSSLEKPIYQSSLEVGLEFRGIRSGWIELRSLINDIANNIIKGGSTGADSIHTQEQSNRNESQSPLLEAFIVKNSVFELLVVGLSSLLLLFGASVIVRITLGLLAGPSSARAGFSRMSLILYLASAVLTSEIHTLSGISKLLVNPIVVLRAATVLVFTEMTLNPWKWVKMLALRCNIRQSGSSTELDLLPNSQLESNVTSTRSIQEERIAKIRADTDDVFVRRIRQFWLPTTVLLLVSSVYRLGYREPVYILFSDMVYGLSIFSNVIASAIQLVVNHRARSGSLVPVGLAVCTIFCYIDYRILCHYCGFKVFDMSMFAETIIVVPSVIHVAQWIIFYKSKQD